MTIIVCTVVLPLFLNKFGAGQVKPIKVIADRLKKNAKEKQESANQRNERLETIIIRVNTTYRDLKALTESHTRIQDDVKEIKRLVLNIQSDTDKILEFIED